MNKQLENKLAEQYPFMKRGNPYEDSEHPETITNLFAAFGYELDDGWYSVLDGMCAEITELYKKSGLPINIKPEQIKEKYGTLRFYYSFDGDTPSELKKEITDIVIKWERKSATVCEECGADGELRGDMSYISTLCDKCYCKRKE